MKSFNAQRIVDGCDPGGVVEAVLIEEVPAHAGLWQEDFPDPGDFFILEG